MRTLSTWHAKSCPQGRPGPGATRVGTARALRASGFSLIELLIVVMIVGILLMIAVPGYAEHVRRSARAEAQAFLTDLASRQQQYLVDKRAYAASAAVLNMALPKSLAGRFDDPVTIQAPDAVPPVFRITAKAVGDQAKDKCPVLSLDSAGNREPVGCW